jgi:glycosyltransferase involved in cell wall biosynthesis
MSCGTPTVGFSIGGIPEMVVDGVSGMLVPQGDASGLVNAIRKALQPGVAAALGREARICAESRHSMALCLDRHVEIYEAAMRHFK